MSRKNAMAVLVWVTILFIAAVGITQGLYHRFWGKTGTAIYAYNESGQVTDSIRNFGHGAGIYVTSDSGHCVVIEDTVNNDSVALLIKLHGDTTGLRIESYNASSTAPLLDLNQIGLGPCLRLHADKDTRVIDISQTKSSNDSDIVYIETDGGGNAIVGKITNPTNSNNAIYGETNGTGCAGKFVGHVKIDSNLTVGDTLTVSGRVKGIPCLLPFGSGVDNLGNAWLNYAGGGSCANTRGYPMIRSGSIVGISGLSEITTYIAPGTIEYKVDINTTDVYIVTVTIDGAGIKRNHAIQSRDIDTFIAGDIIRVLHLKASGTFNSDQPVCLVEVVFDE